MNFGFRGEPKMFLEGKPIKEKPIMEMKLQPLSS